MRVALCCLLAACGRLHFGEQAESDAPGIPGLCTPNASAPDPLTIAGTTFRYTSFDNTTRTPLASVTVQALDSASGMTVATAASDGSARYQLDVPTGGIAPRLVLAYSLIGSFDTRVTIDRPVDHAYTGQGVEVWSIGDGPVWNTAGMASFYSTAGTTRLDANGTLNIAVRDCAGMPIGGVTVNVSPPPELLRSQASDGRLDASATTDDRYATVFGLNAIAGPTTITATADGYAFQPLTISVTAGESNTLASLHAEP